jgi:hypothetical protein
MTETSIVPRKVVDCTTSRKPDALLVPTEWAKAVYIKAGVAPGLVHVVNEPVDSEFFDRGKAGAGVKGAVSDMAKKNGSGPRVRENEFRNKVKNHCSTHAFGSFTR